MTLMNALAKMSDFAKSLLAEWRRLELPLAGERLVLAVSGGADSTALLLALSELLEAGRLRLQIVVAHLDHGLRAESENDAKWVAELAAGRGFEVVVRRVSVKELAARKGDNLEQAARRARYQFLAATSEQRRAHFVLTAHTMDDQAETVLLRLLRGSGAEGLSGIEPARLLDQKGEVLLVRPLLLWARRTQTENYCRERGVEFRVDEMNADERFARVRVRKTLIPLMEGFNGRVVETLSRTALLLRDDARALSSAAEQLLEAASENKAKVNHAPESVDESCPVVLLVNVLRDAPAAVRRRALRQWIAGGRGDLRRLELAHLLAVEGLLEGEKGGRVVQLPGGAVVERRQGRLRLYPKRVENGAGGV